MARPVVVFGRNTRLFPRPRRRRRRNSRDACSASCSRCCSASPASARRRCCAPALVPRLRGEGFCPVYVRVDYAPESPPPSEQIKQAIFRATAAAGHWTRPGSAIEGESLWEFLHHRGDLLRDAEGRTLLPLLIFDQFEEIFTLAQADDAGRLRAKQFLEDLADLVENRPPVALERASTTKTVDAGDFDFARADYRILIALREDYLAHLEGVKGIMPSITQNRMRLARMTGAQALSAVLKPGGRLVSEEVAESIVRFVAGGSELANAEVEPSLLSLICRELNTVRHGAGPQGNFRRPARGFARHDPHGILRARAGRPARRRAARHRGRAAHRVRLPREPGRGARRKGARRRRRRAGFAREAGRSPAAAHRGSSRHAPRRADARRAVQRRPRQPRHAARARGARRGAAATGRAAGARGRDAARAGARAHDRERLRGADGGRRRRRGLRLDQPAPRAGRRRRGPEVAPARREGARRRREAGRLPDRGFLQRTAADRPPRDHGQAREHGRQLLRRPAAGARHARRRRSIAAWRWSAKPGR